MSSLWRFLGLLSASSSRNDPLDFVFDTDLYTDAMVRCLWLDDHFLWNLDISIFSCDAKTFKSLLSAFALKPIGAQADGSAAYRRMAPPVSPSTVRGYSRDMPGSMSGKYCSPLLCSSWDIPTTWVFRTVGGDDDLKGLVLPRSCCLATP
jgi:hypothetical protein